VQKKIPLSFANFKKETTSKNSIERLKFKKKNKTKKQQRAVENKKKKPEQLTRQEKKRNSSLFSNI